MNQKVLVKCKSCDKEWMKESFDIQKWQGNCKSCAKIGNIIGRGNKGKLKTEIHCKNISIGKLGKPFSYSHKLNIKKAKTGAKMPLSFSLMLSNRMKGPSNHFYIDGRTAENQKIRHSLEYRLWRDSVFERDNYSCKECNKRGGNMNAHHIKPFALYPELRFELSNGCTLCIDCHRKTFSYIRKNKNVLIMV